MEPLGELYSATDVLDTIHEGLIIVDSAFRIRWVNRAFFMLFPKLHSRPEGLDLFQALAYNPQLHRLRAFLERAVEQGEPFTRVEVGVSSTYGSGHRCILRIGGHPLDDTGRTARFVLLVCEDVTEQWEARCAVEKAVTELRRSNEALEQFAYAASHDMQEPLRMVTSFLELLQRHHIDSLNEEGRSFVHYALDGAVRVRRLIADLLAYARISPVQTAAHSVDCEALVRELWSQVGAAATDAELRCETLPTIVAHETQLRQVFQNLLGNAIKFKSRQPLTVRVSATLMVSEYVFIVEDNGIGIDAQHQSRIFDAFRRLHGPEIEGSGMGLAICKRILHTFGGTIRVESTPGVGSRFVFTLPVAEPTE